MENGLTQKQAEYLADTITAENPHGDDYSKKLLDKSLKNNKETFDLPEKTGMSTEEFFNDSYSIPIGEPTPSDKYLDAVRSQRRVPLRPVDDSYNRDMRRERLRNAVNDMNAKADSYLEINHPDIYEEAKSDLIKSDALRESTKIPYPELEDGKMSPQELYKRIDLIKERRNLFKNNSTPDFKIKSDHIPEVEFLGEDGFASTGLAEEVAGGLLPLLAHRALRIEDAGAGSTFDRDNVPNADFLDELNKKKKLEALKTGRTE